MLPQPQTAESNAVMTRRRQISAASPGGDRNPAGVLIDMDGTLVDTEKVWDVSLAELATWLGGRLSPQLRAALVGSSLDVTVARLIAASRGDGLATDIDPAIAAERLLDVTAQLLSAHIEWRPGARQLLEELAAAGIPVALVTSTHRRLTDIVLTAIGQHWFTATVCGDEVQHVKPHPEPYLRAARLLGADPSECVAIEDSDTGTRSAIAAGCVTLTVPCDAPVPDRPGRCFARSLADVQLADLRQLLAARQPAAGEVADSRAG